MHELTQVFLMDFGQFLSVNERPIFCSYYEEPLGDAVPHFALTSNQRSLSKRLSNNV